MTLLIPPGSEGGFWLGAPSPVQSVFYQQWKVVMGLIIVLQVRKLRLRDIMRFSWGHALISTEPEGNPDFWHSALSTELIISLWSVRGALIHFYHQWVMTQRHCSSVSWSCHAKWAFSNSSEPNGWVESQMSAGRGLWGAIPVPDYPPLLGIPAWEQASPSCCGGQAVPSPAQQHQCAGSCPAHAWLKLMAHMVYIPSVGWPGQIGRKSGGEVGLASDVMYLHFLGQGQVRFHYI